LGCFGHWVKEADALGRDTTSTHHLVLGLLRVTDGGAVRLLLELGVRPEQVREQVLAQLSTAPEEWPTSMQQLA
jgi:ATP-dependent Clp protease ATP-binding subunit ClpC